MTDMPDHKELAKRCRNFMQGTRRLFEGERVKAMEGDMWLFELYHHLNYCAEALETRLRDTRTD